MTHEDFGLIPHTCSTVPIGTRFGRLAVLLVGKPQGTYRYKAVCQCDCGSAPVVVRIDGLTSGAQVSCGCYWRERHTTHGVSKSPLYGIWRKMLSRCSNPRDRHFRNYGGRGISVCERWRFVENFVTDMQGAYAPGLALDRIDNNGHYEPSNCRWATDAQQSDNRRTGHRVTYNGETLSIRGWSYKLGIAYGTLWERIAIWKWPPERAFTTPAISAKERMQLARAARCRDR